MFAPSVIGNVIVYLDTGGHFTGTYAQTLAPALEKELIRVLGA